MSLPAHSNASETLANVFIDLMTKATTDNPANLTEYAASYFRQLLDKQNFEGRGRKDYNGNAQLSKFANCLALQIQRNSGNCHNPFESHKKHRVDNQFNVNQSVAASFSRGEIRDQECPREAPAHKTIGTDGNTIHESILLTEVHCFQKARSDQERNPQQNIGTRRCTEVSRAYQIVSGTEQSQERSTHICNTPPEHRSTADCAIKTEVKVEPRAEVEVKSEACFREDYITPDEHHRYRGSSPSPRDEYISSETHRNTVAVHDAINLLPLISSSRDQLPLSPVRFAQRSNYLSQEEETDSVSRVNVNRLPVISNEGESLSNEIEIYTSTESVQSIQASAEVRNRENYEDYQEVKIEAGLEPTRPDKRSNLESTCNISAGAYEGPLVPDPEVDGGCEARKLGKESALKGRIVTEWRAKVFESQPEKRRSSDAAPSNANRLEERNRNPSSSPTSLSFEEPATDFCHKKLNYHGKRRKKCVTLLDDAEETRVSAGDESEKGEDSTFTPSAVGVAQMKHKESVAEKGAETNFLALEAKYKNNKGCERKQYKVSDNVAFGKVLKCRNNLEVTHKNSFKPNKSKEQKGANLGHVRKTKSTKGKQSFSTATEKTIPNPVVTDNVTPLAAGALVFSKEAIRSCDKTNNSVITGCAINPTQQVATDLPINREVVFDTGKNTESARQVSGEGGKHIPVDRHKKTGGIKKLIQEGKPSKNALEIGSHKNDQECEKESKSKRKRTLVRYNDFNVDCDDVGYDTDDYSNEVGISSQKKEQERVKESKGKRQRKQVRYEDSIVDCDDDDDDVDYDADDYSDDASYDCMECGKVLRSEEQLIKHQNSHANQTRLKCKTCGKGFKMYGNLWKHERTHSGIKPHKCEICKKAFIVPSKLSRHMRVHTGERPYRCKVCNKSFMQGNDLVRHELIHSGQKPFVCSACGKTFALCGNLKQHEVTHTGDRRHKCSMCDKMFGTSVERRKHERTHSKTKDFKCDACAKAFKSPEYLRKHIKKMHGSLDFMFRENRH